MRRHTHDILVYNMYCQGKSALLSCVHIIVMSRRHELLTNDHWSLEVDAVALQKLSQRLEIQIVLRFRV